MARKAGETVWTPRSLAPPRNGDAQGRPSAIAPAPSEDAASISGVPFNKLALMGNEMAYVSEAIRNGHCSGDGPFTRRCQDLLERELGVPSVLLTTSCTHALEMSALLLDIQPGDEIIVPSFTFVSTVNAFVLRGARPVFADIRRDTLNLDETKIAALVTPRTRAIVVVHYAGVGCEMDTILPIARHHGIPVIEDNAHGLSGAYQGRPLGSLGALATVSFHETKNYSCGEGGALLINDPQYLSRAEIIREKGTDRSRFFRKQVDKYTWVDLGSSYLMSDMSAAFLLGQLEKLREVRNIRRRIWTNYRDRLSDWAGASGIGLPHVPEACAQSYHMFYLIMPSLAQRQAFIEHMRLAGISCPFHYVPLHSSPMGRRHGLQEASCPVTDDVSDRLVRLPIFTGLHEADQSRVAATAMNFRAVDSLRRPAFWRPPQLGNHVRKVP